MICSDDFEFHLKNKRIYKDNNAYFIVIIYKCVFY